MIAGQLAYHSLTLHLARAKTIVSSLSNHQVWGAWWPSGLEGWLGMATGWSWPGSNPAAATSLRNFGNSVYPALPVSFR